MIKKFIQHISEDSKAERDSMLQNLIMTRVNTALDIKRVEIASTVYNEGFINSKSVTEMYESPSIIDIIDRQSPRNGTELETVFHELQKSDQLDTTEYKKLYDIFDNNKADWAAAKKYLIVLIANYAEVPKTVKLLNRIAYAANIKGV